MVDVYKSTYSHIDVYESIINGFPLMRRCDDNWVNATQILKIAGFGKAQRTRLLEREVHKLTHKKIQGGHGKFQGTWIPLELAKELALRHKIPIDELSVLYYDVESGPPLSKKESTKNSKSSSITNNNSTNNNIQSDKKRPLKIDMKPSSSSSNDQQHKKLSSPQKSKKDNTDFYKQLKSKSSNNLENDNHNDNIHNNNNLVMPPTFGMFNNTIKSKLHSKSKSISHIPNQIPDLLTTPKVSQIFSTSNPSSAVNNSYYNHSNQSYQMGIQRELQLLQQQQQQQQQQHQNNNKNMNTSQHSISQADIPNQYLLNNNNNTNMSMISINDDTSMQFKDDSNTSISSHSFINQDNLRKQNNNYQLRYQRYLNSPKFLNQNHDQNLTPFSNSNSHSHSQPTSAPIITNMNNVFETPHQIYRNTRHHSSPQLIQSSEHQLEISDHLHRANSNNSTNSTNNIQQFEDQINNQIDNQEYYTTQLLSFFINDSAVPQFLYDPPSDFKIDSPIDDEGHTPLHWASALAAVDIIKLLIDHNADTLMLNNAGMNSLTKLIHFNNSYDWKNFHIILPLLKDCLVVPDGNQRTPIHYLIELSTIPNKSNSSYYYFYEILNFIKLQQKEAERFNNNNNGNNNSNVRQLLQVIINHSDINNETALHLAIKANAHDFIIELIRNGADIDKVGIHNISPDILKELRIDTMNLHLNMHMNTNMDDQYHDDGTLNYKTNEISNFYGNNNNNNTHNNNIHNNPTITDNNNNNHNTNNNNINNDSNNHDSDIQMDSKNPFLVQRYHDSQDNQIKGTPHTIVLQRTPEHEVLDSEDKENIFNNSISTALENSKLLPHGVTSTPSKMDIDPSKSIDLKKEDINNNIEDCNYESLLKISKSNIRIDEVDNFVKLFPEMISQMKSSLDNKVDHLKYSIETINKLDKEISTISIKNSKFLKKISKVAKNDRNINYLKIANLENSVIKSFVDSNVSKIEQTLNQRAKTLIDLYERSQALEIAKFVNLEENSIIENNQPSKNKLELAIQFTLLQITRRKIIEQTLELYLNEGVNDEDFCFDEDAIDVNATSDALDEYRMMRSKLSVYKKLISSICGLPATEINNELLNGIEKVLT